MASSRDSEDYHSTTELEYFIQELNDSDVEIKVFCLDKDGGVLSGISEAEEPDLPIEPMLDPSSFSMHHHVDPSTYYRMHQHHDRKPAGSSNSIRNLCEAPHLFIQRRHSGQSTAWWLINNMLYLDEYLSFKYCFETSCPLLLEMVLVLGVFAFHHIAMALNVLALAVVCHQIQFAIFALIAWLSSLALIQCLHSLHLAPFRPLPDVIRNEDEYGFNVQRAINLRGLWYQHRDADLSSFPCCHSLNVVLFAVSWYLYSNQFAIFLLVPYVVASRCYFAFHYLFDCVLSGAIGLCIALLLWSALPQTFLVIMDEML